jgi:hypothetical protein
VKVYIQPVDFPTSWTYGFMVVWVAGWEINWLAGSMASCFDCPPSAAAFERFF